MSTRRHTGANWPGTGRCRDDGKGGGPADTADTRAVAERTARFDRGARVRGRDGAGYRRPGECRALDLLQALSRQARAAVEWGGWATGTIDPAARGPGFVGCGEPTPAGVQPAAVSARPE